MDTLLAVLLGIAISMEIGAYTCPVGGFNGWYVIIYHNDAIIMCNY